MKPRRLPFRAALIFGTPLRCGVPVCIGFTVLISGSLQAGDILRGGAGAGARPGAAATASAAATPAATDVARTNARDTLARNTRTLDAMRALQTSARAAVKAAPQVPNGLATGGLQIAPGATSDPAQWMGAQLPTQTASEGKTQVTVKQTAQQALLNWQTLNVGKDTTLTFDQSAGGQNSGQWIAFNRINDPTGNPTQILGKIEAQGQVYLINPNGIIFGGSSQVNTRALTASALPINPNLVANGLLNNPDQQFLFSALQLPAGTNGTPGFTPEPTLRADGKYGDVVVEEGARLTAPTDASKTGGRITLAGANVTNHGTIQTPDGQTILAAGLQIGFDAHATTDPSLRGLDTYVGEVGDYGGTAINTGIIEAARGNITLAGSSIRQQGALVSTTSVSLNGTINLNASYNAVGNLAYHASNPTFGPAFLNRSTGSVALGDGSVIQILPEYASSAKITGTALALSSRIDLTGSSVVFANDAVLLAPAATVTANAGKWHVVTSGSTTSPPVYSFLREGGRIEIANGAIIDVSGSRDVVSSVASNIVEVQLRGSELADAPLLKDGPLRGQTIQVDITKTGTYNGKTWIGTPLADVSGYANLVQRTVGELTTGGGMVNLNAGDAVVIRDGAIIDVSGGWTNYLGANVKTSKLVSGKTLIDIADATPDRVYDGVFDGNFTTGNSKWNVQQTYVHGLTPAGYQYQEGYTIGGAGGSLKIAAASMNLDGTLQGSTHAGIRQQLIAPTASLLSLNFTAERLVSSQPAETSPTPPKIVFSNAGDPTSGDRLALAASLLGDNGFGSLAIRNPDGDIVVPEGLELRAGAGGSVRFSAANLTVDGMISANGGILTFETYNLSPSQLGAVTVLPDPTIGRGMFSLGANAILSTAGMIVDARLSDAGSTTRPGVIRGGSVSIATFAGDFAAGSVIDVSGGVLVDGGNKVSYGNAGTISITAGKDLSLPSVTGGSLSLDSTLQGYSGATGGSLTLGATEIQIGGASAAAGVLHLDGAFFNQGGFASFALSGTGRATAGAANPQPGLVVKSGTILQPVVDRWQVNGLSEIGGLSLGAITPVAAMRAPVSLTLAAPGVRNDLDGLVAVRGDLVIEQGATVDAGARGNLILRADTVAVSGTLTAHGGSIQISGGGRLPTLDAPIAPATTVWLSSGARVDASGALLLAPDPYGRRRGAVLDGGSISVSGNILAESGAVLDVSGTRGNLDLTVGESGRSLAGFATGSSGTTAPPASIRTQAAMVESDGGTITLAGGEMLRTDATLLGRAGGTTASAGTLKISSGRFYQDSLSRNPFDPTLVVVNSGSVIPTGIAGGVAVTLSADGSGIAGGGRFAVDSFTAGGFANLDLGGNVRFSGDVTIRANGRITAGSGPALYADGTVTLAASHLVLGTPFQTPLLPADQANFGFIDGNSQRVTLAPTHGAAALRASAGLIDVGYLSLQGIGTADLTAAGGEIRGNGALEISGVMNLTAAQIYPPTALAFTLAAFDYDSGGVRQDGSIRINASGTRRLPLSAGGQLSVFASEIRQNGVLRAPFGQIVLGRDGSVASPADVLSGREFAIARNVVLGAGSITSVSAIDPVTGKGTTIPYGVSLDGSTWLDPRGVDITSSGAPQKRIEVAGVNVKTLDGSGIDIRGGGDLLAYRWVEGLGGTTDILASTNGFAVIPGYDPAYAPYAPFNSTETGGDAGYANSGLKVGQQVTLAGGGGVPAGTYTLLPARYALLEGAYLITPQSGVINGAVPKADGATLVSGVLVNGLEGGLSTPQVYTRFELASSKVVQKRAEYLKLSANGFLTTAGGLRLPGDAGQLVLGAAGNLAVGGQVRSAGSAGFRSGLIDISSPADIFISANGNSAPAGWLVLDAAQLSGFEAESLLIGGIRTTTAEGTGINVTAPNLTVDNHGSPLTGSEIILVADGILTLAGNAQISQSSGGKSAGGVLRIGDAAVTGSGNGALFRLGNGTSQVVRSGFTPGTSGRLVVGDGVVLQGSGLVLDSTALTDIATTARIGAGSLSLSSGRVTLVLDPSLIPAADAGLVLSGETLAALSSAGSFTLASYSSLDLMGTGTIGSRLPDGRPVIDSLTLRAGEIRGSATAGGAAEFIAGTIRLDNLPGGPSGSTASMASGNLVFAADRIVLGDGALAINGYLSTRLEGREGLQTLGNGGLNVSGKLDLVTPRIDSAGSASYGFSATGAFRATDGGWTASTAAPALGGRISIKAAEVFADTAIILPSGRFSAEATTGDVLLEGSINVGGVVRNFNGSRRFTDGGSVRLVSLNGNVVLAQGSSINVAANENGGDAGTLEIVTPKGGFDAGASLSGNAGKDGKSGNFTLDTATLPSLAAIDKMLNESGFNHTRGYRVRSGDVEIDGVASAGSYHLSADAGSVFVTGTIDASGTRGGTVTLIASNGLSLLANAVIDVSAAEYDAAGKGGAVVLETRGGMLDLQGGSRIDLGVAAAPGTGKFNGTLHLRAPRSGTNVAIQAIDGKIRGASSVIAEGYQVYDLTASGGAITAAIKDTVKSDAAAFIGDAAMAQDQTRRLLAGQTGFSDVFSVRPGVEIINSTANLTLGGTATSGINGDWNLADFRFGTLNVPGILTLRAAGDLIFLNSLSDGFASGAYTSGLLARNPLLPQNAQGWSFRLAAGADFSAADAMAVRGLEDVAAGGGSLLLGKNGFSTIVTGGNNALTSTPLNPASNNGLYQVIRTGSGDIDIATARDIRLLNPFATIYTAGTLVADPSLGGTFDTPIPSIANTTQAGILGAVQQPIPAPVQYTTGGGNVTLAAGNDIIHLTRDSQGNLIADSERQMPINWLHRRGYVDPATGGFGVSHFGETASTTWWVDFTNFFEGVGALGGGNVALTAGRDVTNVDAVAPTNARMARGAPGAVPLVELGGGDVTIRSGRNIDGGVYYVERGQGVLSAGSEITTNATRSPSLTILRSPSQVLDASTWLPTTLFLGKGTFDVSAAGNLLLGPVVNPFLLPAGYNNTFWYKSYFSTYSADSAVDIASLGGDVVLRQSIAYEPGRASSASSSVLQRWFNSQLLLNTSSAAFLQPWLRLSESNVTPFATAFSLLPPTLRVTAVSGNVRLQGDYNLSPAARGTVEILAADSIRGFNPAGIGTSGSSTFQLWADTRLNLSDADPASIPGITTPFAYQTIAGNSTNAARTTQAGFFTPFDNLFRETGSADGVLQQKQTLHASGILHAGDTTPARLFAGSGDIDGLTFFSAKAARIIAGQDIRDVSFYLQNTSTGDISTIAAGRDLIAFDSGTASQVAAIAAGNLVATGDGPAAGDIQISGPGTLEVLTGRHLDLGIGGNNADGTGTGITSIGNGRNPYLPFGGAAIIAGAGIGPATSLENSSADFPAFVDKFIRAGEGVQHLKEIGLTPETFAELDGESQHQAALAVFFLVLRDAGRDHNNPEKPGFGNYDAGKLAVATLFPEQEDAIAWNGNLTTRARDIRTRNGGDISLFAPGGGLALSTTVVGSPLAPPGIITESGGDIHVFTDQDVDLGISRIFTLRGGNEIIWSSHGNIAAGSSSKTVQSAPPTRVLIDPQSADVKTDLAGLATGGGIGVLTSVEGVPPGDVDLIAPEGTIDAGDAGIRVSGNLNIAAAVVVNAGNISVGGASSGAGTAAGSAVSLGSITSSSNAAAAATAAATETAPPRPQPEADPAMTEPASDISVEVIGYGGGDPGSTDEDEEERRRRESGAE